MSDFPGRVKKVHTVIKRILQVRKCVRLRSKYGSDIPYGILKRKNERKREGRKEGKKERKKGGKSNYALVILKDELEDLG